jgi:hypothetical protein
MKRPIILTFVLLCACSAPPPEEPPESRSLAAAVDATRRADLERLRSEFFQGPGFAARAYSLMEHRDPSAWLIAVGASGREHDLRAAGEAAAARDDRALQAALGFSDQQLLADILSGGGTIYSRRADGRNFYEVGPQPLDLLGDYNPPGLPDGGLALETTLWGTRDGRSFKISYSIGRHGITNLQATLDLAGDAKGEPGRAARYTDPRTALPSNGYMRHLAITSLQDEHWTSAEFVFLTEDGTIERVHLARDVAGWSLVDFSVETQAQRLEDLRDERLDFLRLRASGFERTSGRWPRGLHEISFKPWQLTDPASPEGRLGWADYDAKPPAGFELAVSPDEYAVIATHTTSQGRRAITKDGRHIWIK